MDEADRMLNMEFAEDIDRLLNLYASPRDCRDNIRLTKRQLKRMKKRKKLLERKADEAPALKTQSSLLFA
ncbi:unnamed protein product [Protopolystoma xenopodis]|uniref:Uncharacterized protein n=1 Tax=Protopolystoma xenopodis TaxID=117903 RepID=A0A448X8U7_9PLAT|nr:unnamed protein product [Protopolystoma xenopodis]